MKIEFDYPRLVGELNLEQKRRFYVLFAHNLTVSNRGIWSDDNLTDSEKIEGMKWINEIMHRLIFHIQDLHNISKSTESKKTDEDLWQEIKQWSSQNFEIVAGNVIYDIQTSYETVLKI